MALRACALEGCPSMGGARCHPARARPHPLVYGECCERDACPCNDLGGELIGLGN